MSSRSASSRPPLAQPLEQLRRACRSRSRSAAARERLEHLVVARPRCPRPRRSRRARPRAAARARRRARPRRRAPPRSLPAMLQVAPRARCPGAGASGPSGPTSRGPRVDELVGHLDLGVRDGGVERGLAELGLDRALLGLARAARGCRRAARRACRSRRPRRRSRRRARAGRLRLDLLDRDGELGLLAGEVLGAVVVGEGDVDRALLAGAGALELLLEAGHEPAGAELDQLVAALAALERLAVDACRRSRSPRSRRLPAGALDGLERGERSRRRSSSASTSSSATSGSRRPTSRPL